MKSQEGKGNEPVAQVVSISGIHGSFRHVLAGEQATIRTQRALTIFSTQSGISRLRHSRHFLSRISLVVWKIQMPAPANHLKGKAQKLGEMTIGRQSMSTILSIHLTLSVK